MPVLGLKVTVSHTMNLGLAWIARLYLKEKEKEKKEKDEGEEEKKVGGKGGRKGGKGPIVFTSL